MRDWFPSTRWSLIQAAGDTATPASRSALEELCRLYWAPVYVYIRGHGGDPQAAEDLTQGFFTLFLARKQVKQARPDRGRFRSFLLTCVKHHLVNEAERSRAKKRGAGAAPRSLDLHDGDAIWRRVHNGSQSPDRAFERQWALTVIDRVLARLERETASWEPERFRRLKPFLTEAGGESYRDAAAELGITEGAVKTAVHRLRHHFAQLIRDEVAETVSDRGMVDEEIRFLFKALG